MADRQTNCGPGGTSPYPYFSTAHVGTVRSGAGPFTYTLAANTTPLKLFGYKVGEAMTAAWCGDGTVRTASQRDTNIQRANETIAGDEVEILGISLSLAPLSSFAAKLAAHVMTTAYAQVIFDGKDAGYGMGPLTFFPGGLGLSGRGLSLDMTPPLAGPPAGVGVDFVNNGMALAENVLMLPRPMIWTPRDADSTMAISLNFPEAIAFTSTAVSAAAGVDAFVPPAAGALGTYIEIVARLICNVTSNNKA